MPTIWTSLIELARSDVERDGNAMTVSRIPCAQSAKDLGAARGAREGRGSAPPPNGAAGHGDVEEWVSMGAPPPGLKKKGRRSRARGAGPPREVELADARGLALLALVAPLATRALADAAAPRAPPDG